MMNKQRKRLIPFGLLPAAWGLKGKSRRIAEAEYYFEGAELEKELINIQYQGAEAETRLLEVDLKYKNITQLEFDKRMAKETLAGDDYELRMLEIKHNNKEISDREYKKQVANVKKESYIEILKVDSEGSFEFDWNEYFIKELEEAGFGPAPKEEMVVDEWFTQICKNITIENYQGDVALLDEQIEERRSGLVQVKEISAGLKEIK